MQEWQSRKMTELYDESRVTMLGRSNVCMNSTATSGNQNCMYLAEARANPLGACTCLASTSSPARPPELRWRELRGYLWPSSRPISTSLL